MSTHSKSLLLSEQKARKMKKSLLSLAPITIALYYMSQLSAVDSSVVPLQSLETEEDTIPGTSQSIIQGSSKVRRSNQALRHGKSKKSMKKPKRKNKDESVGIVGAGFSGLFSAWHLAKLGFKDITIYEKSDRVGGVAKTHTLEDGRPYDLHTMWIPDSSVYGAGIPDFYEEILSSFRQEFVKSDLQDTVLTPDGNNPTMNSDNIRLHPGVAILLQPPFSLTRTQIIEQNVLGFRLLKDYQSCVDKNMSCTECGICDYPGELPEELGARTATTAIMIAFTALANSLGGGPAGSPYNLRTADLILRQASLWYPAVMAQTFNYFGVTVDELRSYNPEPELVDILEANNGAGPLGYLNLKNGFQAFADKIADKFTVVLNTEVTNVLKIEDKWNLETISGTYEHDILVLANPPRTVEEKAMFPVGPVKQAVELIDVTQPKSHLFLYDVGDGWDNDKIPAKVATTRVFANNLPQIEFGFLLKRYADSGAVEIAGGIPQGVLQEEQIQGIAENQLKSLLKTGASVERLSYSQVMFPPVPLPHNEEDWQNYLKQADSLRQEGLFLHGEHVCGSGIPQLAACIKSIFSSLA